VTLLYDEHRVARQCVEPIAWTAREFALVRSLLGKSQYEVLARWPLVS
jgi:2'-5' RNA ligase